MQLLEIIPPLSFNVLGTLVDNKLAVYKVACFWPLCSSQWSVSLP